jgi:hypothetical protein
VGALETVELVHLRDVRVAQTGGAFRLAQEALGVFRGGVEPGGESLHRNGAPELRVVRLVDDPHAAVEGLALELVAGEGARPGNAVGEAGRDDVGPGTRIGVGTGAQSAGGVVHGRGAGGVLVGRDGGAARGAGGGRRFAHGLNGLAALGTDPLAVQPASRRRE